MIRHYFLLASTDFFLYQEPIEEVLRERLCHYKTLNKEIDFGLTTDLSFLDLPHLEKLRRQLIKPSVAIISLNPRFIDWMKLRVHYGIKGSFLSYPLNFSNKLVVVGDSSGL